MFTNSVKIAFFGNSEFSLIVLKELKKNGIVPELIVTTPDKPQGRKMIFTPTPTKVWASDNSIECVEPKRLQDETFIEKIKNYNLYIVASYGKIIPKNIINLPKYKVLNIHPSLLPNYRGPSPLQTQILNDEKNIGVSVMLINEKEDHGPILAQSKVDIAGWPVGFFALQETLAKEGSKLLSEILPDYLSGKIKAKAQNESEVTHTKKVEKNDGLINLSTNPYNNFLKTLAFEEWPKTYFNINGKRVIVIKAVWKNNNFEILKVTPEGKKEMDYSDFLRGVHN